MSNVQQSKTVVRHQELDLGLDLRHSQRLNCKRSISSEEEVSRQVLGDSLGSMREKTHNNSR